MTKYRLWDCGAEFSSLRLGIRLGHFFEIQRLELEQVLQRDVHACRNASSMPTIRAGIEVPDSQKDENGCTALMLRLALRLMSIRAEFAPETTSSVQ
jgi:hypothetical protein